MSTEDEPKTSDGLSKRTSWFLGIMVMFALFFGFDMIGPSGMTGFAAGNEEKVGCGGGYYDEDTGELVEYGTEGELQPEMSGEEGADQDLDMTKGETED